MSCVRKKLLSKTHTLRYPASDTQYPSIDKKRLMTVWRQCVKSDVVYDLTTYISRDNISSEILKSDFCDFMAYFLENVSREVDSSYLLNGNLLREIYSYDPIYTLTQNALSNTQTLNRLLNVCVLINVNPFVMIFLTLPVSISNIIESIGYDLFLEYNPFDELVNIIVSNSSNKTSSGVFRYIGIIPKSSDSSNINVSKRSHLVYYLDILLNAISYGWNNIMFDIKVLLSNAINRLMDYIIQSHSGDSSIDSSINLSSVWSPIEKSSNYTTNILKKFGEWMGIFDLINTGILPSDFKELNKLSYQYFTDQKLDIDILLDVDNDIATIVELGFFIESLHRNNRKLIDKIRLATHNYVIHEKESPDFKSNYSEMLYERLMYLLLLYQSTESNKSEYRDKYQRLVLALFRMGVLTNVSPNSLVLDDYKIYIPFKNESFVRNIYLNRMFEYLLGNHDSILSQCFCDISKHDRNSWNYLLPMYTLGDYTNINRCMTNIDYQSDGKNIESVINFVGDLIVMELTVETTRININEHIKMLQDVKQLLNGILIM